MANLKRIAVFAHFDKHNVIDPYVEYLLQGLKEVCSTIYVVSTSELKQEEIEKVKCNQVEVILRPNIGYDFCSYKLGIEKALEDGPDELVICNDSVYGPLYSMKEPFLSMDEIEGDFWGMSECFDRSYHLQSYFLVVNKNILKSEAFKNFWNDVKPLDKKVDIIEKYEIGFTQHLIKSGFKPKSFTNNKISKLTFLKKRLLSLSLKRFVLKFYKIFKINSFLKEQAEQHETINGTHILWKELIKEQKYPFIKIELLRDNPLNMNISDCESIVFKSSDYPYSLIQNHLHRMKSKSPS